VDWRWLGGIKVIMVVYVEKTYKNEVLRLSYKEKQDLLNYHR